MFTAKNETWATYLVVSLCISGILNTKTQAAVSFSVMPLSASGKLSIDVSIASTLTIWTSPTMKDTCTNNTNPSVFLGNTLGFEHYLTVKNGYKVSINSVSIADNAGKSYVATPSITK